MNQTLILACPACHALNRVIPEKLGQARCGKCQAPLNAAAPLELTIASFSAHAEKSELPLLVDFWAPWCGPCKMMAPAFAEAADELAPAVRLAKVNTEAEQSLAARFNIRSTPDHDPLPARPGARTHVRSPARGPDRGLRPPAPALAVSRQRLRQASHRPSSLSSRWSTRRDNAVSSAARSMGMASKSRHSIRPQPVQ